MTKKNLLNIYYVDFFYTYSYDHYRYLLPNYTGSVPVLFYAKHHKC